MPTISRTRQPIKRADMVYEAIKHKLVTGALISGARVDINGLVDEMQTSRQPVLAAINRLAAEGFLRVVPQVGCWVASVQAQEVSDFFRFFALNEGLACELGTQRKRPAQMDALRATLAKTTQMLATETDAAQQARAFFKLNREFHGLIHDMAHSDFVADLAAGMWDRCDFYLASSDPTIQGERGVLSEHEHEAIVEAMAAGQARRARQLMVAHIESFGEAAVQRLGAPR